MPTLETTDRISTEGMFPRGTLPHRPGAQDGKNQGKSKQDKQDKQDKQEKHTGEPDEIVPIARRASRLRAKQTEDNQEVEEWKQADAEEGEKKAGRASAKADTKPTPTTPDSVATTTETVAPAGRKPTRLHRPKLPAKSGKPWYAHPFFYLGVGMIFMLALWALVTSIASWWSVKWDDIQYGRPRTFQIDAVVGHNDSPANPSHFIAINLNGRIEVIEFPGGDGSKARIYIGPQLYGNGEDLVPVTLSFVDVNGNHHPDMILHFQSTQIVFINDNGGFRPATPSELQSVQRYLQQHGG